MPGVEGGPGPDHDPRRHVVCRLRITEPQLTVLDPAGAAPALEHQPKLGDLKTDSVNAADLKAPGLVAAPRRFAVHGDLRPTRAGDLLGPPVKAGDEPVAASVRRGEFEPVQRGAVLG